MKTRSIANHDVLNEDFAYPKAKLVSAWLAHRSKH
jgi:hypothetical protein